MLNTVLEYLHNPAWIKFPFFAALLFLIFDAYLMPYLRRKKGGYPLLATMSRGETTQYLVKMTWYRTSANFYLMVSFVAATFVNGFVVTDPNTRIALNFFVVICICTCIDKFRRAVKIKRLLAE